MHSLISPSVVKGPISTFTTHAYIPKTILTDNLTTFIADVVKAEVVLKQAGICIKHETIKQTQAIRTREKNH